MFVIPCKYSPKNNRVIQLVSDIRAHHGEEEILVVDSDSEDKSYFDEVLKHNNVIVADVKNTNYHVGAYWYAFFNYNRPFYYFLHDSLKVKANLHYLKDRDFSCLATFGFENEPPDLLARTSYKPMPFGTAIYGPIFFCKRGLMEKMHEKGASKILPTYSEHSPIQTGVASYKLEGFFGSVISQEGYDVANSSLLGDIIQKSGGAPQHFSNYDSSWQYPIEKFLCKRA